MATSEKSTNFFVLIVDDEPVTRNAIGNFITQKLTDFRVVSSFTNGADAIEYIQSFPVDIVISDIRMPRMDGLELAERIHQDYPSIAVLILSGYSEFEYARRALQYGVTNYLLKPLDFNELAENLNRIKIARGSTEETSGSEQEKILSDDLHIQKALEYIHSHYAEDLTRDSVASAVFLSTAYFSRLFREKMGQSFIDYLTEIRMAKAAELLKTNMRIEVVAKKVGYLNRNQFSKNFLRFSGKLPTEYRKGILQGKEFLNDEKAREENRSKKD